MLAVAAPGKERIMMDWTDSGWSWWWMVPMMLFMAALIGTIVWAVLMAVQAPDTRNPTRPSAEDILNERFARGEIDSADYREYLDALHGNLPASKA
jgi:putative membrane protein